MKKIVALLTVAFLLISACIIYLIKTGVSIRSAPLIRPSVVGPNNENIPNGLIIRLTPELQNASLLIWGLDLGSAEAQSLIEKTKEEYEVLFHKEVQVILKGKEATPEEIRACADPCWVLVGPEEAHELHPNSFIENQVRPLGRSFFTLSVIPFSEIPEVPDHCVAEKRLSFECLKILTIHEAQRKMKDPNQRYFFLRKYLDQDFFLFIQNPK